MHTPLRILRDQRGIAFPMAGIAIIAVLAVGSLGTGFGHVFMVNSELQNAADAGALGGVRAMFDGNSATLEAEGVVKDNFVSADAGSVPLDDDNIVRIVTGNYTAATGFQSGMAPENAVEVVTAATVLPILRAIDFDVSARSVAAMTGDSEFPPPRLPIAIGDCRAPSECLPDDCPDLVGVGHNYPQTGWTAISQSAIRANIRELFPPTAECGSPCFGENDGSGTVADGDTISLLSQSDPVLLTCVQRCLINPGIDDYRIVSLPVVPCESFSGGSGTVSGSVPVYIESVTLSGPNMGIRLRRLQSPPATGGGGAAYYGDPVISLVE